MPLPTPASRTDLIAPAASADALLIARQAKAGQLLAVITASPLDAQRLLEEVNWFAPELRAHLLPDWETLPFDHFSPHPDLISERLATLHAVVRGECDVLITAATTAITRLAPPQFLAGHTFFLKKGERVEIDALRHQFALGGYQAMTQVVAAGEYAVRGGLVDLFPMGAAHPYRIELFGDEVESIRSFDVDSQRTLFPVPEIRLLPAREFPLNEAGRNKFRQRFRETFAGDASRISLYKDVSNGTPPAGIEYYLPLFFDETATLFHYLPQEATLLLHRDVPQAIGQFWREVASRHKLLSGDAARPVLSPRELFLSEEEFFVAANQRPVIRMKSGIDVAKAVQSDVVDERSENSPPPSRGRPGGGWGFQESGGRNQESGKPATPSGLPLRIPEPHPHPNPPLEGEGAVRAPAAISEASALPPLAVDRKAPQPLAALQKFLAEFPGRVLLLAESPGRRETIADYLAEHDLRPAPCADFADFTTTTTTDARFMLGVAPLSGGFMAEGFALITENELYAATARPRHKRGEARATSLDGWLRDLSELKIGDPVVHEAHGIGRYRGLTHLDYGEGDTEFLHLEYADNATLYVPVAQLQVITRYSGANPDAVELHRLGSGQWEKARRRAAIQVHDTAAELLDLYARRAAREGHAFNFQQHDLEAFAANFGFEETPDQQAAINAVISDMQSGKPMDRLVCGDVGFGKTEVALRAAFIAVADGKQVAVLCPTTLLAEQHYQTFADRFADWPVKVAELSRFRSAKEQAEAIHALGEGRIDILIGTHRLLQKDVRFARLGLVILDEEHRFGVRQKEALKALRAEVDVLTLTATPIPRTLGLSLEGLRDFSVIATAPQKRLAIKTFVARWSTGLIREACLRELQRGGQIYFLHNEVDTILTMQARLEKLLPEARIIVGHGQLPERELERVMREFTQQRHNLLLCSTIIETGIDNPHANTIIIHRADKFGLAQLHQLRGRVGRSHHQAYAYLLTPEDGKPTREAQRRLEAIQAMEELGAGFFLAMHDLEIRGAGEVLGENQSGEMQEIGFALYANMLNTAIHALKAGHAIPDLTQPLSITAQIDLHTPALLPDSYCPDVHERLTLYKRLANCETQESLQQLTEELIDRFGPPPPQTQALLETHHLRLAALPLGVSKLDASANSIQLQFKPNPPIDPSLIIQLIQSDKTLKLAGPDKLSWQKRSADLTERTRAVREILGRLGAGQKTT